MASIDDFIVVTEVERGPAFAGELFRRKYRAELPDFPHHVVAFVRRPDGAFAAASYCHFTDCGDILLAGGACTDGDVLRALPAEQQQAVAEHGALMLATLRYGFERWGQRFEAVFTCCGDPRALETTPKVGFLETGVQYLLVRWMREVPEARRAQLLAKARTFMPF